jgi:hypothetical protein
MKIIDFCENFDKDLWEKTLEIIVNNKDELKNNYINLSPKDFVCWPVLIENNEIVCFSGLQINQERWGDNFARINSRFFISPKYRHRTPGKLNNHDKFLNTKYLLPVQIEFAKEMGLKGIFMSREGDHKKVFEHYANLAYKNTGYFFKILTYQYNVCGQQNPVPESCKQWIALHCFDGNENLWNTSMKDFEIIP